MRYVSSSAISFSGRCIIRSLQSIALSSYFFVFLVAAAFTARATAADGAQTAAGRTPATQHQEDEGETDQRHGHEKKNMPPVQASHMTLNKMLIHSTNTFKSELLASA